MPPPTYSAKRLHAIRRAVLLLALATAGAMLAGCEAAGLMAQVFKPKVKALHQLGPNPTAIVVDDPDNALGDPRLAGELASSLAHELATNEAGVIVPAQRLADLAARTGSEFPKMSMARVGREVGASKVLSVHVDAVSLEAAPGLLRPAMAVRVRVVDVPTGKRIFPPFDEPEIADPQQAARGYVVQSLLFYKSVGEDEKGAVTVALKRLVKRSARDVAWLFYDHHEDEPGDKFKD
jgi:hypothetical protein